MKNYLLYSYLFLSFSMTAQQEKAILITGGCGYIGSATVSYLIEKGQTVVVLDTQDPQAGLLKLNPVIIAQQNKRDLCNINKRKLYIIKSDFASNEILDAVFSNFNIQAVMHFAAFLDVNESTKNPEKYYTNNIVKTLNLLSAMRRWAVNKFIFSSSCTVYGPVKTVPIEELHIKAPISPYGNTKHIVETILADYTAYNIKSVSLRYFNAAGALPDLGELHDPEIHVIPLLIDAAYRGHKFTVFGTDYNTPDGTCIRDYLHILDLARAHYKALKYLISGGDSQAFNLGTEHGASVKQLLSVVEHITGKKINTVFASRRAGDSPAAVANAKKAWQMLGWQAKHSSLEEIVSSAYAFYKSLIKT